MLCPRKVKYRKQQKSRNTGLAFNGYYLCFGNFGLKAITRGKLTSKQIEAGRRVISKYIKKEGKLWVRIFPDKPITKKPLETRMGKGKGALSYWCVQIQPGKILYEINIPSIEVAKKIFSVTSSKLPFKTTFVKK